LTLSALLWVCTAFARKNGRYFTCEEKTRAIVGKQYAAAEARRIDKNG
jgi:hypothetical protein